jgi:tRNA A-37 threonylcarbamoyl transferase component Bud32
MSRSSLRHDLALNPEFVAALLAERVDSWKGDVHVGDVRLLARHRRRVVVRYEIEFGGMRRSLVGKWYASDRGELEADALVRLRTLGFEGSAFAVPAPIAYVPEVNALFIDAVEGRRLRDAVREDETLAARAGSWLAAFHRCGFENERERGPGVQRQTVARWADEFPRLWAVAGDLDAALELLPALANPVHYDYSPANVLLRRDGATVAIDFDEVGMGDPAFDLAHMEAHLGLVSFRWFTAPERLGRACNAFMQGYAAYAPLPERRPALVAFAWFKLAYIALVLPAPEAEADYALEMAWRSLSAA